MSEFREQWPLSTDLKDHAAYMQQGIEVINDRLLLPQDGRWNDAYGGWGLSGAV